MKSNRHDINRLDAKRVRAKLRIQQNANLFRLNRQTTRLPETVGYIGITDTGGTSGLVRIATDFNKTGNISFVDFESSMVFPSSARINNQNRMMFTGQYDSIRGGVQIWDTNPIDLLYINATPNYQGGEIEDGFYFVVQGDRLYRRNIETHAIDWDVGLTGWSGSRACHIHSHRDGYVWVLPIRDNNRTWTKVSWAGMILEEVDNDTVCAGFDIYRNGDLAVLTRNPTDRKLIGLDRYEPDGTTLKWRFSLTDKEPNFFEINYNGVQIDEDDNVFACWEDQANSRGSQYFKLAPDGSPVFNFQFGGQFPSDDRFTSVAIPSIDNDFFYMSRRNAIGRYNRSTGSHIEDIHPIAPDYTYRNLIVDPGYLAKIK